MIPAVHVFPLLAMFKHGETVHGSGTGSGGKQENVRSNSCSFLPVFLRKIPVPIFIDQEALVLYNNLSS